MDIHEDLLNDYDSRLNDLNSKFNSQREHSPVRRDHDVSTAMTTSHKTSIIEKIWSEKMILALITLSVLVVLLYVRPFTKKVEEIHDGKLAVVEHIKIVPTLVLGIVLGAAVFGGYIYVFKKNK